MKCKLSTCTNLSLKTKISEVTLGQLCHLFIFMMASEGEPPSSLKLLILCSSVLSGKKLSI